MALPCLCCGYLTVDERGSWEVCPVCFWEDDPVQAKDPNFPGGANQVSLREARENFRAIGASEPPFVDDVRKPKPDEIPVG